MHTRFSHRSRRAITLLEVLVVVVVIVVLIGVMLPSLGCTRCSSRQLKDSTQVRTLVQACIVWASNGSSSYPLPSVLDADNATLDAAAWTKDTTGNILSILIMNGSITPEMCISPAESNTAAIRQMNDYEYATPHLAARLKSALWDPSFRGTPDDAPNEANLAGAGIGHQSYAHAIPFGRRRSLWAETYISIEPVFANRGPTYAANDAAPSAAKWALLPGLNGTASNTLLIHGGRNTWEGNVGYNDLHVNFETKPVPDQITLSLAGPCGVKGGKLLTGPDNLFVNEIDEEGGDGVSGRIDQGVNAYLRPIADVLERARPRVWRD